MANLTITLVLSPRLARCAIAATLLTSSVAELASESVTLTTYYPAPSGIYSKMISTGDTWLARDNGHVGIGTETPMAALDVRGDAVRLPNHPVNPAVDPGATGSLYYNTTSQSVRAFNGSGWSELGGSAPAMYISPQFSSTRFNNIRHCHSVTFTKTIQRNLTQVVAMMSGWEVGDFYEVRDGGRAAGLQLTVDSYNPSTGIATLRMKRLSAGCNDNWDKMQAYFYIIGY